MNTHEQYVSLETAKLLKQAGFDWATMSTYWTDSYSKEYRLDNDKLCKNWNDENIWAELKPKVYTDIISAPTQAVAMRWLREVERIDVNIDTMHSYYNNTVMFRPSVVFLNKHCTRIQLDCEDTYEQAVEKAIQYGIKLLIEDEEKNQ